MQAAVRKVQRPSPSLPGAGRLRPGHGHPSGSHRRPHRGHHHPEASRSWRPAMSCPTARSRNEPRATGLAAATASTSGRCSPPSAPWYRPQIWPSATWRHHCRPAAGACPAIPASTLPHSWPRPSTCHAHGMAGQPALPGPDPGRRQSRQAGRLPVHGRVPALGTGIPLDPHPNAAHPGPQAARRSQRGPDRWPPRPRRPTGRARQRQVGGLRHGQPVVGPVGFLLPSRHPGRRAPPGHHRPQGRPHGRRQGQLHPDLAGASQLPHPSRGQGACQGLGQPGNTGPAPPLPAAHHHRHRALGAPARR
jgi:hypothetical protein